MVRTKNQLSEIQVSGRGFPDKKVWCSKFLRHNTHVVLLLFLLMKTGIVDDKMITNGHESSPRDADSNSSASVTDIETHTKRCDGNGINRR